MAKLSIENMGHYMENIILLYYEFFELNWY